MIARKLLGTDEDRNSLLNLALIKIAQGFVVKKMIQIGCEKLIKLENNGEANSLHYACAYDPSSDVVQKILEIMNSLFVQRR